MFDSPTLSISPYTQSYISNLNSLPTPKNVKKKFKNVSAILSPKKLQLKNIRLQEKCKRLQKLLKSKRATISFLKKKQLLIEKNKINIKQFLEQFKFSSITSKSLSLYADKS